MEFCSLSAAERIPIVTSKAWRVELAASKRAPIPLYGGMHNVILGRSAARLMYLACGGSILYTPGTCHYNFTREHFPGGTCWGGVLLYSSKPIFIKFGRIVEGQPEEGCKFDATSLQGVCSGHSCPESAAVASPESTFLGDLLWDR